MTSSRDVIVLSSSPNLPPRTPTNNAVDLGRIFDVSPRPGTPPSLPSPSEPFPLPSRSRFFPTPKLNDDASKTKRRMPKEAAILDPNGKNVPTKPRQRAKKAAKEPKSSALGDLEPDSLDLRVNVIKKAPGPQKGRPRKSAKSKESGNMTLAGKVTKTSREPQAKKPSKVEKETAEARLSPGDSSREPGSKESNALEKDEDLNLDRAMRRRVDWTPPKETAPREVLVVENDDELVERHPGNTTSGLRNLSDYNYSGSASETRELPSNAIGGGLTKRRRIELVDPQVYAQTNKVPSNDESSVQEEDSTSSGSNMPKRKPKRQKRFTTLTARMTAQYTANDTEEDLMDDIVPEVEKAKSRRGKTKSKDKSPIFTVLSPEAAAKSLENQDLMFGTCSQLEREDSPHALKEMQQAIRESEGLVAGEGERNTASDVVSRRTGTRNLWSVASRDTEGSLIRAESLDIVDLTDASEVPKTTEIAPAIAKDRTSVTRQEDGWLDLDFGKFDSSSKKKESEPAKRSKPAAKSQSAASAEPVAPVREIQAKMTSSQRASSQQPSMPQYSGFTDAELSTQVASFGFKSVRGRKKMIELLQKCWESKHGSLEIPTSSQKQHETAPAQTVTETTISKPKRKAQSKQSTTVPASKATAKRTEPTMVSTPKKSTQKASKTGHDTQPSFIDVEEIEDSEEEIFLSPSQVQKRYTEIFSSTTNSIREPSLDILTKPSQRSSPAERKANTAKSSRATKKVTSSVSSKPDKADSSTRGSLPDLSMQITKAVRTQSQSSHPSSHASRIHPTWQEKIVMYDPIILEDLTTWLNVEGLGLVGEDREVHTGIVREWCESRGICCCWKKNASW